MKRFGGEQMESFSMAGVLMLMSGGNAVDGGKEQPGRVFECKTCSRRFPSFQALGGHRASHKKPRLGDVGKGQAAAGAAAGKPRVHECSICGLEFPVGQALGGHMRRHRPAVAEEASTFGHGPAPWPEKKKRLLDLNLPPLTEEEVELKRVGLGLVAVEREIPMVLDCFH